MITHLEPDILECKVKWALGSITLNKASGGDGIPVELFQILKDDTVKVLHSICQGDGISVELFQILKDDAVKVLHSICQQTWKTRQWPQDWKMSVFIPIPKKGSAKEYSNYCTIALISHASKVMLKIVQAMLQLEKAMATHSSTPAWKIHGWRSLVGCSPWGHTFTFHFHALEKEMATHSSVLAWRIPGTGEAGGLPSMGLHRVEHN